MSGFWVFGFRVLTDLGVGVLGFWGVGGFWAWAFGCKVRGSSCRTHFDGPGSHVPLINLPVSHLRLGCVGFGFDGFTLNPKLWP